MTTSKQEERLAVLETKMDIVIEQQKGTNDKLDQLLPTFATKTELEQMKKDWADLKKKNNLQIWLTGSLAAIFGAVMSILVKSYFGV